jgi:hypothetical protein
MEDYSFASEWGREKAGEMGGVIKRMIWLKEIPLISVAPQSLKAFIGVMKKDEIMKEVFKKWKIDTNNSDEADAIVLAKMGIEIIKFIKHGMTIASQEEQKTFESTAYKSVGLKKNEAKTVINLLVTKGGETYEFAKGKERARKAQGKQKQTKRIKDSGSNSNNQRRTNSRRRGDDGSSIGGRGFTFKQRNNKKRKSNNSMAERSEKSRKGSHTRAYRVKETQGNDQSCN